MSHLNSCKMVVRLLAGAPLLLLLLFASKPVTSQNAAPPAKASAGSKQTPRTLGGHPDLNGFWNNPPPENNPQQFQRASDGSILFDFNVNENDSRICLNADESCQNPNQPPYKSEYMAHVKEIAHTGWGGTKPGDPTNNCMPQGVPRASGAMQIIQTPTVIGILYEAAPYSTYRIIYTDGRSHPSADDLELSNMGDSIGHWEGDTLVVDVVGLNDETWLGGDVPGHNQYTTIHSDKEHVIERWTRQGDTLTYEATVEDPVMFTKPWVITPRHIQLARPNETMQYNICRPFDTTLITPPAKGDTGCPIRCDSTK